MPDRLGDSHRSPDRSNRNGGVDSTVALLLRARDGDDGALNELCTRYLPRLRRWAHGRLPAGARDHLDTEDIVQDALLKTIRRLDGFAPRHDGGFCGYVSTALRNRLRDAARQSGRHPAMAPLPDDARAPGPSPLEAAVGAETIGHYEAALDGLSAVDRELVIARVELGLDYGEIADLLGKPSADAARVATSRALLRLAREMGRESRP
jgi:RNA polymerase sigma-70 factor (ECF subfamily)